MDDASKSVAKKKADDTTTSIVTKDNKNKMKNDKQDRLSEQLRANLQRRKKRASSS